MGELYVDKTRIFVTNILQTLDSNVDRARGSRVALNLQMEVLKCLSIAYLSGYVHGSTKRCE